MISIFKTIDNAIHQIEEPEKDCWISMIHPDENELHSIAERYAIDIDDLRAALDEEERSRIEAEPGYTLVLVDIPKVEKRDDKDRYVTQPLGILLTKEAIITVCLEDTPILKRHRQQAHPRIPHPHEDALRAADSVPQRFPVPAIPALHRPRQRDGGKAAARLHPQPGADRAVGAGEEPGLLHHVAARQRGGASKSS